MSLLILSAGVVSSEEAAGPHGIIGGMGKLRISGLVRLADQVRRQFSQPLSPQHKAYWRRTIGDAVGRVEKMLQQHGTAPEGLPPASRRAYLFLRGIDWDSIRTSDDAPATGGLLRLSWPGMGRLLEHFLEQLASMPGAGGLDSIGTLIGQTSRHIELSIARARAGPEQLTPVGRDLRGWLGFFAESENRAAYVDALRLAQPILEPVVREMGYPMPLLLHFRPARVLYRIPRPAGRTVLWLPTAMISFDAAEFRLVGDLMLRRPGARQRVVEAMEREPYQAVCAGLESLGGIPQQARGAHHDLEASFGRVNARYFGGQMQRPQLTWSRMLTGRKLGHYDSIRDTVMISATLDSPLAEVFLVDFLMYHELLHKHLGSRVVNGRRYAHTAQFYDLERRFERHQDAETALRRLVSGR
jgi:hypothetical protein